MTQPPPDVQQLMTQAYHLKVLEKYFLAITIYFLGINQNPGI
jgi:hypothetical protein